MYYWISLLWAVRHSAKASSTFFIIARNSSKLMLPSPSVSHSLMIATISSYTPNSARVMSQSWILQKSKICSAAEEPSDKIWSRINVNTRAILRITDPWFSKFLRGAWDFLNPPESSCPVSVPRTYEVVDLEAALLTIHRYYTRVKSRIPSACTQGLIFRTKEFWMQVSEKFKIKIENTAKIAKYNILAF